MSVINNKNTKKCNPGLNSMNINMCSPQHKPINNGTNDQTNQNSFRYSRFSKNPAGHSSTIQYTDGDLIDNLRIQDRYPDSLTISFTSVPQSFTTYLVTTTLPDGFKKTDTFYVGNTFTITGLTFGKTYSISLTATNYFKVSTTKRITGKTTQPPYAPINLFAKAIANTTVDLSFNPPPQIIDTYRANVYSGSSFLFFQDFSSNTVLNQNIEYYRVAGLVFNTNYNVNIIAINTDGISTPSNSINFTTTQVPDTPLNIRSPIQTPNSIDISFNKPPQPVTYYLIRAYLLSTNQKVFDSSFTSPPYTVTGLQVNTLYNVYMHTVYILYSI